MNDVEGNVIFPGSGTIVNPICLDITSSVPDPESAVNQAVIKRPAFYMGWSYLNCSGKNSFTYSLTSVLIQYYKYYIIMLDQRRRQWANVVIVVVQGHMCHQINVTRNLHLSHNKTLP